MKLSQQLVTYHVHIRWGRSCRRFRDGEAYVRPSNQSVKNADRICSCTLKIDQSLNLWLVHSADNDDKTLTRLSVFAVWTELATSKDVCDWKFRNSFVHPRNAVWTRSLALTQFRIHTYATWLPIVRSYLETGSRLALKCVHTAYKTGQNHLSNILKTVCDCHELSSHHRQDKNLSLWTRH